MKKLIIANWKMNPTSKKEALRMFTSLKGLNNVIICPPFPYLSLAKGIKLGAQDCFYEEKGSFTAQVSPLMLKDLQVKYVLIGHSERRILGETDEVINKKIKAVLKVGLTPVLCVGETKDQRDKNQAFNVLEKQVEQGLKGIPKTKINKIIIAYEPVWAIGTGETATPEQAQEMHKFIRSLLSDHFGKDVAEKIRILYGGSMKPDNAEELLSQPDVDGGLIGGASLKADSFSEILSIAESI